MFENGDFVFFFDGELHLADLKSFLKFVGLSLQVPPLLFFLPSGLVAGIQVSPQVLNLLLLLPEDLPQFVSGVPHVLQHQSQFTHGLCGLV